MRTGRTENGIQYAVRSFGNAVAYCALSIKVGTRDEGAYHGGIAHFTEHTIFKGTARHGSDYINNRLEQLGGELNAYTTREEIVLHSTVLCKDIDKAAALLAEIAFEASFPEDEIEVEKGVVIDEIASYKDSPSDDIYDVFEEKLFAGGPLSRPILGTEESVRAISSDELRRFRKEFFQPERMAFTMVAPIPEEKMEAIVGKVFAEYKHKAAGGGTNAVCQNGTAVFCETVEKNDHQVNCIIGGKAPAMKEEQARLATILLCNMLGGPASNSILGRVLRERHGWVYNVECSYSPYSDCGAAIIAFGCDRENLAKCRKVIRRELHRLQEKPVTETRLKAAKRQLLGQNAIALENGEAQCLSMGKSLLSFGEILSDAQVAERLQAIPSSLVHRMAIEVFGDDNLSELTYL